LQKVRILASLLEKFLLKAVDFLTAFFLKSIDWSALLAVDLILSWNLSLKVMDT